MIYLINWQYYPKSDKITVHLIQVVRTFEENEEFITSSKNKLNSDGVLTFLKKSLIEQGFEVEKSKKGLDKIRVPVLFGMNGKVERSFDADAYNKITKTVIEVEAGRAVTNYQFLKDLFEACVMHDVEYLVIAVRKNYRGNPDFEKIVSFFNTLYSSQRLQLPLNGVLVIGY